MYWGRTERGNGNTENDAVFQMFLMAMLIYFTFSLIISDAPGRFLVFNYNFFHKTDKTGPIITRLKCKKKMNCPFRSETIDN